MRYVLLTNIENAVQPFMCKMAEYECFVRFDACFLRNEALFRTGEWKFLKQKADFLELSK